MVTPKGSMSTEGETLPSFCPTLQVLDMLLSALSVLVVVQLSLKVPEGLMNYPVFIGVYTDEVKHAVAQLVEALHYKLEGRGFDSRWCHWNFSLT